MNAVEPEKKGNVYDNLSGHWKYISVDRSFPWHTDVVLNEDNNQILIMPLPSSCSKKAADFYLKIVQRKLAQMGVNPGLEFNPEYGSLDDIFKDVCLSEREGDIIIGFGHAPLERLSRDGEVVGWFQIGDNMVMTVEYGTVCDVTFRPMHDRKEDKE